MTVRVVPWKCEVDGPKRWRVDIRFKRPDGTKVRDRKVYEAPTRGMAQRWGHAREGLLRDGSLITETIEPSTPDMMTVAAFAPEYVSGHLEANLVKRSAIDTAQSILRCHVLPFIGGKPLDKITDDVVADLRAKWTKGGYDAPNLDGKGTVTLHGTTSRKTLNNRLSILLIMLKTAMDWKAKTGLRTMPCTIHLLKVDGQSTPAFLDHGDYERLVDGARAVDARVYALVLLAGDGGLRRGEIIGLNLTDVDFKNARMTVRRNVYVRRGVRHVDDTKGLLAKPVPLTARLAEALKAVRHLRGERALYQDDGSELTPKVVRMWIERAERKAGLPVTGRIHVARHTFCSHAAMAGVPVRTIQDLARHASIQVTMRYMHLSPSALDDGIAMLAKSREAGGVVVTREAMAGATCGATVRAK